MLTFRHLPFSSVCVLTLGYSWSCTPKPTGLSHNLRMRESARHIETDSNCTRSRWKTDTTWSGDWCLHVSCQDRKVFGNSTCSWTLASYQGGSHGRVTCLPLWPGTALFHVSFLSQLRWMFIFHRRSPFFTDGCALCLSLVAHQGTLRSPWTPWNMTHHRHWHCTS